MVAPAMTTDAERLKANWDRSFGELQSWVSRTGALPGRRSKDVDEYRLANWLNRQRTDARKNTIDPERERRLRTVAGALEPRARRLSDLDLAERVRSFHATYGRLPRNRMKGESTAAWYLSQIRVKAANGDLSPDAGVAVRVCESTSALPGSLSRRSFFICHSCVRRPKPLSPLAIL